MGMHLICAARCKRSLSDRHVVTRFLRDATRVCGLHLRHIRVIAFPNGHRSHWQILCRHPHRATEFGPGLTGIVVLSESHMSIHTMPETGTLYFDLFSCRTFHEDRVRAMMEMVFDVTEWQDWRVFHR
jgi:S-adenosylmethionine/arginine decarboxylase-like enzyme